MSYQVGDTYPAQVIARDAAGDPADPASLALNVRDPAGTLTSYAYPADAIIVRDSAGQYHADIDLTAAGAWVIEWVMPGEVESVEVVVSLAGTARTPAEATARRRLVAKLAPDMEPALTAADIDDLLTRARRMDTAGLYPSEDGYVATWTHASLDAAASEGWEIRAARCFDDIDFGEDGQRFNEAQRHKACLDMAKLYRRGAGSVTLSSAAA